MSQCQQNLIDSTSNKLNCTSPERAEIVMWYTGIGFCLVEIQFRTQGLKNGVKASFAFASV